MSAFSSILIFLLITGVGFVYHFLPEHFYLAMYGGLISTLFIIGTEIKEAIKK